MLFVLSPAKTLDFTPPSPDLAATRPALMKDIAELARVAHRLSAADLKRLMHISDKLADLNAARFKAFKPKGDAAGVQAALAFAGDVYEGLKARELDADALAWAQDHMRILSGLYGVLRPLDRIQPYRLEMGIRLATDRGANLYDFWGDRIAKTLNAAARGQADPTLVNLASQEYFGGVDRKALKLPLVTCLFKQEGEAGLRTVALYAKTARGLMARFIIDHRLERADDLKAFDREGYVFRPDLSDASDWLFVREDRK
jgi:cytoplasmic iron level regulating protein YaaA (DUF328/UPF0246 family)